MLVSSFFCLGTHKNTTNYSRRRRSKLERPKITTYILGLILNRSKDLRLPLKERMKKFVLMLDLQEDTDKRRALKTVCTLSGINEITIEMKAKKLIVIGTVDPVTVVSKLRKKNWPTDIISVGPAMEAEKKEDEKKENPKKEDPSKEEVSKEPKENEKGPEPQHVAPAILQYRPYYPSPSVCTYYYAHSIEEYPNACVIN